MQGSRQKMRAMMILAVAVALRSWIGLAQEPIIPRVAVGPQYDSTHVYVAPENVDAFVKAFLGTFGGESFKAGSGDGHAYAEQHHVPDPPDPGWNGLAVCLQNPNPVPVRR